MICFDPYSASWKPENHFAEYFSNGNVTFSGGTQHRAIMHQESYLFSEVPSSNLDFAL